MYENGQVRNGKGKKSHATSKKSHSITARDMRVM
jgi:hypothetical protein